MSLCRALFASATLAFVPVGAACRQQQTPPTSVQPASPTASAVATEPGPVSAGPMAASPDAGPFAGPWVGSLVMQTQILSEPEFPNDKKGERESKAVRLGYLRYGEKVPAMPGDPLRKGGCQEGWYALQAGGFVCGKYVTVDLQHPKFKTAQPPDLEGPLPYTYGVNLYNGTPLYRQLPSRAQRRKLEPWLYRAPRKAKVAADDDNPYSSPTATGGSATGDSGEPSLVSAASPLDGPDTPWWERQAPDGGLQPITLEDLQETGPVARRMVKGFYLSLDHPLDALGWKWWKTVSGLTTPSERIMIQKPLTDYHGVWLGRDDATFATKNHPARRVDSLPIAFVMGYHAKRWALDEAGKHASIAMGDPSELDHFDAIGLTGQKSRVNDTEYWEADEGFWLRAADFTRTDPGPAPEKLGEHEKWVDVNLRRQTLVAFEGMTPVYATVFSSGRNEHETVPGVFRIREKHLAATMDGDAQLASDGPYSIEDVPYIEYFNGSYALHGAFWHTEFGHVKSHGCVNLAPWDAKALFGWTEPQLPEGWHAIFATKDRPGTRVIVHERAPGTCEGPKAEPPMCPSLDARGRPLASVGN